MINSRNILLIIIVQIIQIKSHTSTNENFEEKIEFRNGCYYDGDYKYTSSTPRGCINYLPFVWDYVHDYGSAKHYDTYYSYSDGREYVVSCIFKPDSIVTIMYFQNRGMYVEKIFEKIQKGQVLSHITFRSRESPAYIVCECKDDALNITNRINIILDVKNNEHDKPGLTDNYGSGYYTTKVNSTKNIKKNASENGTNNETNAGVVITISVILLALIIISLMVYPLHRLKKKYRHQDSELIIDVSCRPKEQKKLSHECEHIYVAVLQRNKNQQQTEANVAHNHPETPTEHVYETVNYFAIGFQQSGPDISRRPPHPLPPQAQIETQRYVHYDTPYEFRIFRLGVRPYVPPPYCGRCVSESYIVKNHGSFLLDDHVTISN